MKDMDERAVGLYDASFLLKNFQKKSFLSDVEKRQSVNFVFLK